MKQEPDVASNTLLGHAAPLAFYPVIMNSIAMASITAEWNVERAHLQ